MDIYGISNRYPYFLWISTDIWIWMVYPVDIHMSTRPNGYMDIQRTLGGYPYVQGMFFYQYPEDIHHGRTMDMAVLPLYVSFDIEINIFYIKEEQCSVNPIYDICL